MTDDEIRALKLRISAAFERVQRVGRATMRIPAHEEDPDVVLEDCGWLCEEVLRLRAVVVTAATKVRDLEVDLSAAQERCVYWKVQATAVRADLARHRAVERWAASVCRSREMEHTADALLSAAESQWQDVPPEALAGAEERPRCNHHGFQWNHNEDGTITCTGCGDSPTERTEEGNGG